MSLLSRLLGSLTTATTVFSWDGRSLTLRKGSTPSHITSNIEELLRDTQSPPGTISLRKDGRISFSDSLPPPLHQRIRNVLHTN